MIATLARDYSPRYEISAHHHDRDQLIYGSRGVMTVQTSEGTWVVPTHRAVWVPAGIPHSIHMSGMVSMRTLYFMPGLARKLPKKCCVVNVSPLLRELIFSACRYGNLQWNVPSERHLTQVITDELRGAEALALQLPHPTSSRVARIAEILAKNPGDQRTLAQLCKLGFTGKRTIERLFQEDVGMTFSKWRQQLRLMHAMKLLAAGAKITHVALESGYSTPSAFISMFRKVLGTTPRSYFKGETR